MATTPSRRLRRHGDRCLFTAAFLHKWTSATPGPRWPGSQVCREITAYPTTPVRVTQGHGWVTSLFMLRAICHSIGTFHVTTVCART